MARTWLSHGSVERVVAAPPDVVYRTISDVTSTGERSQECRRVEWLDGATAPVLGARFRGYNRTGLARWSRVCEVVEAEPGTVFAFRTIPSRWDPSRRDSTTWRYELAAADAQRTRVRHSYEITKAPLPPFKALFGVLLPHHRDMRPPMQHTLDSLATSLERPPLG
jgi:hypothetical protein